jgi:hypothetical protein
MKNNNINTKTAIYHYVINNLNKCFSKYFIIWVCFSHVSLFASDNIPKNKKNNRDTTVLENYFQAMELAQVRFSEDSLFTPEQMREDLLFFYEKILATHPNPYYVFNKDSLDKKVQNILKRLDKPMNRREFWLKIATLHACFDEHTNLMTIGEIYDYHNANSRPPMSKNIANNTIMLDSIGNLCFNSQYKDSLLAGKQIKSVNNIPAYQIVDEISNYYSHENKNMKSLLFSAHFFLLFANIYGTVDTFHFEYFENENETTFRSFYSVELSKNNVSFSQTKQQTATQFNLYEENSIAIIEINTFDFEKLGENFRKYLETIMDTIVEKNIKHLFVDISANQGGSDFHAVEILNFIKTKKKKYYNAHAETKISPAYCEFMGRMFGEKPSLTDKLSRDYRKTFHSNTGSIIEDDFYWTKNNSKVQYSQNLYLIQSTMGTYSASTTLASLIKSYKIGVVIGEETKGLTSCYTNAICFAMPNTSIPFTCSTRWVVDVGGTKDRGVIPDVEYKIGNPFGKSFSFEQLKEMLKLVEEYTAQNNKH